MRIGPFEDGHHHPLFRIPKTQEEWEAQSELIQEHMERSFNFSFGAMNDSLIHEFYKHFPHGPVGEYDVRRFELKNMRGFAMHPMPSFSHTFTTPPKRKRVQHPQLEQYRFPRSKTKRMQKKWRKDMRNWRYDPKKVNAYFASITGTCHECRHQSATFGYAYPPTLYGIPRAPERFVLWMPPKDSNCRIIMHFGMLPKTELLQDCINIHYGISEPE